MTQKVRMVGRRPKAFYRADYASELARYFAGKRPHPPYPEGLTPAEAARIRSQPCPKS
jgi:hypothetical protein